MIVTDDELVSIWGGDVLNVMVVWNAKCNFNQAVGVDNKEKSMEKVGLRGVH